MTAIFGLFLFFICFGSLIITFVAIIQILNNDFNGSKGLWILISMMAIVGPILYLTKGRKLIIKRDKDFYNSSNQNFSLKQYYIDLIRNLDFKLQVLIIISVSLIIIGYFVRIFDLYYFWESKPIGFAALLISIAVILRIDIKIRKEKKLKNIWSHIGFWIITFMLFVKLLMIITIPNTDAYKATKDYIKIDSKLKDELGVINGYSVLPDGGLQTSTDSNGTTGAASISLIIKGTKKYKECIIYVEKEPNTGWIVKGIE
jgi:hypothetical protein